MIQISMAYTTPAIVAMKKTVTRRHWKLRHVLRFHHGTRAMAWSRQPQYGGERIAIIELIMDPYLEKICDVDPRRVYVQEGFEYLDQGTGELWEATQRWCQSDDTYWVVPFTYEIVYPSMVAKYTTPEAITKARMDLLRFLPKE